MAHRRPARCRRAASLEEDDSALRWCRDAVAHGLREGTQPLPSLHSDDIAFLIRLSESPNASRSSLAVLASRPPVKQGRADSCTYADHDGNQDKAFPAHGSAFR